MEKSIETIWKEGFLSENALLAPKLNNLYNQKSQHIIERTKRMIVLNRILLIVFSVLTLIVYWGWFELPLIAIFLAAVFIGVTILSKYQDRGMNALDAGSTSYEYLKSFRDWLKGIIALNSNTLRYIYPAVFVAVAEALWLNMVNKGILEELLVENPEMSITLGMPTYLFIAISIIALILTVYGKRIYIWDVNLMFGRIIKKLDEIVCDMEELRD